MVEGEERRRLLGHGTGSRTNMMRDLVGDLARDQQVEVAQAQREGGPREEGRQLDAAGAVVVALDVGAALLVVDLGLLGVGHHVARQASPK